VIYDHSAVSEYHPMFKIYFLCLTGHPLPSTTYKHNTLEHNSFTAAESKVDFLQNQLVQICLNHKSAFSTGQRSRARDHRESQKVLFLSEILCGYSNSSNSNWSWSFLFRDLHLVKPSEMSRLLSLIGITIAHKKTFYVEW